MADVAVIGCGLMGSALARQFAASGFSVLVWNRTTAKAQALEGEGIAVAASAAEAVGHSSLVVACTATYSTTRSALEAPLAWKGKTLVNLAVGTPGEARAMAAWAAGQGANYLDGMPMCFPKEIGEAGTMVLFSGPDAAWRNHAAVLGCLGGASTHVSEDVGLTNVLEVGLGAFFITAQRAYVEAVNYLQDEGAPPTAMRMVTRQLLDLLATTTTETVDALELNVRQTAQADQATLAMFAEGARTNLIEMRAAGHTAPVLAAAVADIEELVFAGHGDLGIHARESQQPAGC